MQFRLRTLLIVLAVGPPVLAAAWFSVRWLSRDGNSAVLFPLVCYLAVVGLFVLARGKQQRPSALFLFTAPFVVLAVSAALGALYGALSLAVKALR